jgi:hypothetical protein
MLTRSPTHLLTSLPWTILGSTTISLQTCDHFQSLVHTFKFHYMDQLIPLRSTNIAMLSYKSSPLLNYLIMKYINRT